ncbi:hypothetical protein ACFSQT_08845 [Mesorhizobium calcicola]|uniref:Nitroreductase domain-containing protein n=1 Tax=Mesorhizobium calcicola TaxID=1300310 RepID=A0ABW4WBN5_9HYPH
MIRELPKPEEQRDRSFIDVMESRRSATGGPVSWQEIEALLWYACRTREFRGIGRAGVPLEHRISPSAGGLHAIQIICQMSNSDRAARAYLPTRHAAALLCVSSQAAELNREQVKAVLGIASGCTLRLIADLSKIDAAYVNGESLAWRDAGVVSATLSFVAEWLGLRSNVLGFSGNAYLPLIGFPTNRFMAVGAVQISSSA